MTLSRRRLGGLLELVAVAILLLIGLAVGPASGATTRIVDQVAGPYHVAQVALDAAECGDVVQVNAGTYRETLTFSRPCPDGATITVRGDALSHPTFTTAAAVADVGWEERGGGIYRVLSPQDPTFDPAFLHMDAWNPGMLFEDDRPMRHATPATCTAPPPGRWCYDAATHLVYVHPRININHVALPRWTNNVTVRPQAAARLENLRFTAPRAKNFSIGGTDPSRPTDGFTLVNVTGTGAGRYALWGHWARRMLLDRIVLQEGCRGMSFAGFGCFGVRCFDCDDSLMVDSTVQNFGTYGPGWTSADTAYLTAYGTLVDPKETLGFTMRRVTLRGHDGPEMGTTAMAQAAVAIDRCVSVTVEDSTIGNVGVGISSGAMCCPQRTRWLGAANIEMRRNTIVARRTGISIGDAYVPTAPGAAFWALLLGNRITAPVAYAVPAHPAVYGDCPTCVPIPGGPTTSTTVASSTTTTSRPPTTSSTSTTMSTSSTSTSTTTSTTVSTSTSTSSTQTSTTTSTTVSTSTTLPSPPTTIAPPPPPPPPPPPCRTLRQRCTKDGPDRCCPTTPKGTPLECRGRPLTCHRIRLGSRRSPSLSFPTVIDSPMLARETVPPA